MTEPTTGTKNPWQSAIDRLREDQIFDEHTLNNWFKSSRFNSYQNGSLLVDVPSGFFADWLRDHYLDEVTEVLKSLFPDFVEVKFVASSELEKSIKAQESPATTPTRPRLASAETVRENHPVNDFVGRSFDTFVLGPNNRVAQAITLALVESPGNGYSPLFLQAGTGRGKTHLAVAAWQELAQGRPEYKYIPAENLGNKIIFAIRTKATEQMRKVWRGLQGVVIDDVEFFAGKPGISEELVHLFDALHERHRPIILASRFMPADMKDLDERLRTRFSAGTTATIAPPDLDTRIAILTALALRQDHVALPEPAARLIAEHVTDNVRELEGALKTVLARHKLLKEPLTADRVQAMLSEAGHKVVAPVTIDKVKREVAKFFSITISDLCGRNRCRKISFPRQVAMYLCQKLMPGKSLNDIGREFGGKDHTTVLYACKQIDRDLVAKEQIAPLERIIVIS